jgi:hypothetical protein
MSSLSLHFYFHTNTSKSARPLHLELGSYKINICLAEECRHDSSFALIQMSRISTPRLNLPFNIKIFIFHVYSFIFNFFVVLFILF